MMMPAEVQQVNGRYRATLLGIPSVCGHGATSAEAVEALRVELTAGVADGRLTWIDVPTPPHPPLRPFTPEEIEITREMVAEIYRERDAQKAAEFPE